MELWHKDSTLYEEMSKWLYNLSILNERSHSVI